MVHLPCVAGLFQRVVLVEGQHLIRAGDQIERGLLPETRVDDDLSATWICFLLVAELVQRRRRVVGLGKQFILDVEGQCTLNQLVKLIGGKFD